MPNLVCDKCGTLYDLEDSETPDDYYCPCGGSLKYKSSDAPISSGKAKEKNITHILLFLLPFSPFLLMILSLVWAMSLLSYGLKQEAIIVIKVGIFFSLGMHIGYLISAKRKAIRIFLIMVDLSLLATIMTYFYLFESGAHPGTMDISPIILLLLGLFVGVIIRRNVSGTKKMKDDYQ